MFSSLILAYYFNVYFIKSLDASNISDFIVLARNRPVGIGRVYLRICSRSSI